MTSAATGADPRALADRLTARLFTAMPLEASEIGVLGYDDQMPDVTAAGHEALRVDLRALLDDAQALDPAGLSAADAVTLRCVTDTAQREALAVVNADIEHTVTAMPFSGVATLFAVAARTLPVDADGAAAYLSRLERSGAWIDQIGERLREGAARGRVPVRVLLDQAVDWADALLAPSVPPALLAPDAPAGWDGADAWRADVERLAREVVRPALGRWRDLLAEELAPVSRPEDKAGLCHLPGGGEDYARDIQIHTTLAIDPDELHRTGVEAIAELEARLLALGAEIGLNDLTAIHAAIRHSAEGVDPAAAIEAATVAIRRAEARAPEMFPAPLPPPCVVEAMPPSVGEAGTAPHYTPPREDGSRPGTYWYNTLRATAGGGWDRESVAFHEAVPGHHLQLSRAQLLTNLPGLQQQLIVTAHAEGWGLYAEQLAEEMGLYSDVQQRMGAVTASLMRAGRLVVDSGLHALGWSREQAAAYMIAHVPMPESFLRNEVDRYLVMPGQALAYHTGKVEILRLRDEARAELGAAFDLPGFHAAVLDSGSVPLPVLADIVHAWTAARAG